MPMLISTVDKKPSANANGIIESNTTEAERAADAIEDPATMAG